MSPNVGNFVHDLVEMAKAMETLPGVQAELASAQGQIERSAEHIQRLEMKLMERSAEIDKLNEAVRNAEASRDDAELRFLEADDHIAAFRRLVSGFSTDTVNLLRAIDPPKPEPVVEAKPEPVYPDWAQPVSQSASPPSAEPSPIPTDAPSTPAPAEAATSTGGADAGVSVPQDPTSSVSTEANAGNASASVEASALQPSEGVSVEATPTQAPEPATGTGTEPVLSASEEPTRFEWVNGIKHTRDAWYAWYDQQPYEFKQNFDWNAA